MSNGGDGPFHEEHRDVERTAAEACSSGRPGLDAIERYLSGAADATGDLAARALELGDQAAWNEIVARAMTRRHLWAYAYRLTRCTDRAEELLAAATARLLGLEDFDHRGPAALYSYIRAVLRSLAFKDNRRSTWLRVADEADIAQVAAPEIASVEHDVLDLVKGAADESLTILRLRYLEGMSMKELAETLNLSESGVRSRLSRAIGELRKRFGLEPPPGSVPFA